jgi:Rhs element Vgr protein
VSALPFKRPTDVVTLKVLVDGKELPRTVPILGVEVINQVNRVPYARLRIGDGDASRGEFRSSNTELFVPGNKLELQGGYHGETESVFSGVVLGQRLVARNGTSWLEVECRDAVFAMTLTRKNRYFEKKSDREVLEEILKDYGDAGVSAGQLAPAAVKHPQLLQYQSSDWDFAMTRLDVAGQLCCVEGGKVNTVKPSLSDAPLAELGHGLNVLELEVEIDARTQTGELRAVSWDPAGQKLQEIKAADPGWSGNGNLDADKLSKAAKRKEALIWHGGSLDSDALQEWADSALLRARMAAARGRVRFQGIAAVKPGKVLELARMSDRFNGKVYVTGVRHDFSGGNWTTDAEFGVPPESHAERVAISHLPAAGLAAAVHGLQIGVVTAIAEDPAKEHRVRVRVPLAGMDKDGVWARVAALDAGKDCGTFFRPELDDEVVLGFLHDDPAQPVILGMLHSSARPPPVEPTKENDAKVYVSRKGIALRFDDKKKSVILETPGENRLVLDDDAGSIVLENKKNGNKITLDSKGIKFESTKAAVEVEAKTDFKTKAMKMEMEAQTTLTAKASAKAEVSSSGNLTLKGSVVMIN